MRKRKFVGEGDMVLVSLRDFQDDVCDIIDSYDQSQAKKLQKEKHIPESFKLGEDNLYSEDFENDIEFTYEMPNDDDYGEKSGIEDGSSDSSSMDFDDI